MSKKIGRTPAILLVSLFIIGLIMLPVFSAQAEALNQIPTVNIATVTSTSSGVTVLVRSDQTQVNVRSGPGRDFPKVGVLLTGQTASAKGRSVGGDWILIDYPGVPGGLAWVYSFYVDLSPGDLQVVEPPPTPTPLVTNTIDPTLAAQFVVTIAPTSLATFTAPAPLAIPTFQADNTGVSGKIPLGLAIIILGSIGILLGIFSFTRGR